MLSNLAPQYSSAEKYVDLAAKGSYFGSKKNAAIAISLSIVNIIACPLEGVGKFISKACKLDITGAYKGLVLNTWDGLKSIALTAILIVLLIVSFFSCCGNVFRCLKKDLPLTPKPTVSNLQLQIVNLKNEQEQKLKEIENSSQTDRESYAKLVQEKTQLELALQGAAKAIEEKNKFNEHQHESYAQLNQEKIVLEKKLKEAERSIQEKTEAEKKLHESHTALYQAKTELEGKLKVANERIQVATEQVKSCNKEKIALEGQLKSLIEKSKDWDSITTINQTSPGYLTPLRTGSKPPVFPNLFLDSILSPKP